MTKLNEDIGHGIGCLLMAIALVILFIGIEFGGRIIEALLK